VLVLPVHVWGENRSAAAPGFWGLAAGRLAPGQQPDAWGRTGLARGFARSALGRNWPIWSNTAWLSSSLLLLDSPAGAVIGSLRLRGERAYWWTLSLPVGGMNGLFRQALDPGVAAPSRATCSAAAAPMLLQRWPRRWGRAWPRPACPLAIPHGLHLEDKPQPACSCLTLRQPARIASVQLSLRPSRPRSAAPRWCQRRGKPG